VICNYKNLLAVTMVLGLLFGLLRPLSAAAEGGTFPASPFNGMQITYSVSGATITSSKDVDGFTTSRTITGQLGSGTLRVSGSAKMGNGYSADVVVRVWAGDQSKESPKFNIKSGSPGFNSQSFDVVVPIPSGASSGGFSIAMTGFYNAGTRQLQVTGSLTGSGVAPSAAPPAPTVQPTAAAGGPRLKVAVSIPEFVQPDGSVSYQITLKNEGTGDAPNVWIKWWASADFRREARWFGELWLQVTPGGSTWPCESSGGGQLPEYICGPGMLKAGASANAHFTLKVPPDTSGLNAVVLAQAACPGATCYAKWEGSTTVLSGQAGQPSGVKVSSLSGEVQWYPASDPEDRHFVHPDDELPADAVVETGEESNVILTLLDNSVLKVNSEAKVVINVAPKKTSNLDLIKGKIWVNFNRMLQGQDLEARGSNTVLGIKGTTFEFEVRDGFDRISVIEGVVAVSHKFTGEVMELPAGVTILVTPDGFSPG
jgi:hypothetical protein